MEIGRGDEWVAWTADEPCPQADDLSEDVLKTPEAPAWCALETHRAASPDTEGSLPDEGEPDRWDPGDGEG